MLSVRILEHKIEENHPSLIPRELTETEGKPFGFKVYPPSHDTERSHI